MDTFFLAALEFKGTKPAKVEAIAFDEKTSGPARLVARFDRLALEPGETRSLEFDLVVAKKSYDLLAIYNLEEVCEFTGFSGPFAILLIRGLAFFHGIAKDWGLAIILLTIAVRIALHLLAQCEAVLDEGDVEIQLPQGLQTVTSQQRASRRR
jgi:membrane protein insertase Oxa1/YidC/SpoIIIJ